MVMGILVPNHFSFSMTAKQEVENAEGATDCKYHGSISIVTSEIIFQPKASRVPCPSRHNASCLCR